MEQTKHPAPFTPTLIPMFAELLTDRGYVGKHILDPFAGVGRIHRLRDWEFSTTGVEIQEKWAEQAEGTLVGNVLHLVDLFGDDQFFDAVVTSPCYGNRFADKHNAQDGSVRRSYTHDHGEPLHPDNAGTLQWGDAYRNFHEAAWEQVDMMLPRGGHLLLNIKDHIRNKQRQFVAGWHVSTLCGMGFTLEEHVAVPSSGMRYGENHDARVIEEQIYVFRKGE